MDTSATDRTWILVLLVLVWIVAQYGLAAWALRDLWQRPRVRGDNKIAWALLILIVPIVGPLLYSSLGPTSFLPRPAQPRPPAGEANVSAAASRPFSRAALLRFVRTLYSKREQP